MTARALSEERTRALRMRAQRLTGRPPTDAVAVVAGLCGVQAQDSRAARLAIRARSRGLETGTVDRACDEERLLVRTWAMRGTLHLLASRDAGWMIGLLGPIFAAAGRPRRLALGLEDELCERALGAMRVILGGGAMLTRGRLVQQLNENGLAVDRDGQAPAHLAAFASLRGVLCHGPPSDDGEATYVLLDEWLGQQQPLEPECALAELARRYLAAHGPASAEDCAAWSGAGLRRARRGFELISGELCEVEVAGRPAWLLASAASSRSAVGPRVSLLAHFDPYLLGYRSRDLLLDPRHAKRIQTGGGFVAPAVLVDGRVAGTWRLRSSRASLTISVEPFAPFAPEVRAEVQREAADVARFLGAADVRFALA
ncbi:MAG: winged helix DNA-binding domain-containing protein [Actinomycetota bacterium]|nr:winged helix DNA-binding domain-containing protein [Actinomycetota bacterium]